MAAKRTQSAGARTEDSYDDYSDDFSDEEEDASPSPKKEKSRSPGKARAPGRGRGRAKARGHGPGRRSQAKSEPPLDEVTKRLLSANHLRLKELQNQLHDVKKQLKVVKDENKLFKQVQHKQERALRKFDDTESQLPQLIQAHNNEVRSLREQLRRAREKYEKTDRYLRDAEDELEKANTQMKKYKTLSEQKNLGERSDLERRLNKAETSLEEKNDRLMELERHLEMVKKNHRHEMGIERAHAKETQAQIDDIKLEKAKLEAQIKEKEKQLEAKNIYSNRVLNNGSPAHSPPPWRQNLKKKSDSMTDLSFRDRAKAYEDKRKANVATKKEKVAKTQEPKQKTVVQAEEKEQDTTAESKKIQREDSDTDFWRRQEERYKQDQQNREKQEEERRRKEEEEARLRQEHETMKRELEARHRAERERKEAAEREQRERERKAEMERKEREEREREEEREERERKEAEERAKEKREEELRAREEQEREARLAEEQRKKEELLRRLQQMDGSSDKPQPSSDPFAPSNGPRERGGDRFAPSPSKKKDYTFTQSVKNLHEGKPSHDHAPVPHKRGRGAGEDSDVGGYQPSFTTGPIRTVGMKQKKPLSLFDDTETKPAAESTVVGSADKKSKLMADLFGSQASSDSKKDSDDFLLGSRPVARQPLQNKRAPAFPWDNPQPMSSKPKEREMRESSALFGGGAAVVDDNDESVGPGSSAKPAVQPRRPRQTATTFSSKPAVLAVDNFDDDIEEVVL